MKTFCIITANHNRPKIFTLWCMGIQRLRKELGIDFPAVVVSDYKDVASAKSYDIHHIDQKNNPVNEKFNTACKYAETLGVDYVMVLGSDDLVTTDTMRKYLEAMEDGVDVIGVNSVYFYATQGDHRGTLLFLQRKAILGVGRMVSRYVMDKVEWRPWNVRKDWALDAMMWKNISPHIREMVVFDDGMIVDCKSRHTMNKFELWMRKINDPLPRDIFWDNISETEQNMLGLIW